MREPPQKCLPYIRRLACHGQCPAEAFWPPTILLLGLNVVLPHTWALGGSSEAANTKKPTMFYLRTSSSTSADSIMQHDHGKTWSNYPNKKKSNEKVIISKTEKILLIPKLVLLYSERLQCVSTIKYIKKLALFISILSDKFFFFTQRPIKSFVIIIM